MTFRTILNEEFSTWARPSYLEHNYPIYTNPNFSEMKECVKTKLHDNEKNSGPFISGQKGIRFIIDKNLKKVFIAPAFVIHSEICRALKIQYSPLENQFNGLAFLIDNKMHFVSSDTYHGKDQKKEKEKYDWSFADKYFTEPVNEILGIKKVLKEEFKTYIKVSYGPTAPVYINPTMDEILDCTKFKNENSVIGLKGSIKFIVDATRKNIIVFPGFIIHNTVWRHLKMPGSAGVAIANRDDKINPSLFCGEGRYYSGKINFIESDVLFRHSTTKTEMLKIDWTFADKYFTSPVAEIIQKYIPDKKKAEFEYKFQKMKKKYR